jgi:hypothetical protein
MAEPSTARVEDPISICVEDRFWPPGSFFKDGKAVGTHIEQARRTFEQLNLPYQFEKMPWKRCIQSAASGAVDSILSISHSEDREKTLHYPQGANSTDEHPESLEHVTFVLVTRVGDTPPRAGEPIPKSLQPIGIPLGYNAGPYYGAKGIDEIHLSQKVDMLNVLARKRINSLLMAQPLYTFTLSQRLDSAAFHQTKLPELQGPLYLAFSRKSDVTEAERKAIWRSIATLHSDEATMKIIQDQAHRDAAQCLAAHSSCE